MVARIARATRGAHLGGFLTVLLGLRVAHAAPVDPLKHGLQALQLDGTSAPLASLISDRHGTLVVFATVWCRICIEELPHLSAWKKEHEGARVLYVMSGTKAARTRDHCEAYGVDPEFVVIADHDGKVADAFGVRGTPSLYLVDGKDRLRGPFKRVSEVPEPTRRRLIRYRDVGHELGTSYTVTVLDSDSAETRVKKDLDEVRRMTRVLEARLSEWKRDSEISRLNRTAGAKPFPLSHTLATLIRGAVSVSSATGGAFDVTWRPWGRLWEKAEQVDAWPTEREMAVVRDAVGYQQLVFHQDTITFRHPKTELGIAGVAKGWIIDAIFEELRRRGYESILVNIGGDLRFSGSGPDGAPRTFTIADPFEPGRAAGELSVGRERAMATSGNYFRLRRIQGEEVGHIVDPRSGLPPPFKGSVTVLTRDAAMADALATALFVMGPKEGLRFAADTPDVDAVYATQNGLVTTLETGLIPRALPLRAWP
ncbi:MAG: FAD:protein FMN transferase [Myxococcota bacterium]